MSFVAQYYGKCRRCEQPITPGQLITYDDDATVHASQDDCNPYSARVEQRSASICPKCFLTQPCGCDD